MSSRGLLATVLIVQLGCAACGEEPKPDREMAAMIRRGSAEACGRDLAGLEEAVRGVAHGAFAPGEMSYGSKQEEISVGFGSPELVGLSRPSAETHRGRHPAVFCSIPVELARGGERVSGRQLYEIRVGDDFGPDFHTIGLRDVGLAPDYARFIGAADGRQVVWSDALTCSKHAPGQPPPDEPVPPEAWSAGLARWRAEAAQAGVTLPDWVGGTALGPDEARPVRLSTGAAAVAVACALQGCRAGVVAAVVEPSSGAGAGLLRVRQPSGMDRYWTFGHDVGSYLDCLHLRVSETPEPGAGS